MVFSPKSLRCAFLCCAFASAQRLNAPYDRRDIRIFAFQCVSACAFERLPDSKFFYRTKCNGIDHPSTFYASACGVESLFGHESSDRIRCNGMVLSAYANSDGHLTRNELRISGRTCRTHTVARLCAAYAYADYRKYVVRNIYCI